MPGKPKGRPKLPVVSSAVSVYVRAGHMSVLGGSVAPVEPSKFALVLAATIAAPMVHTPVVPLPRWAKEFTLIVPAYAGSTAPARPRMRMAARHTVTIHGRDAFHRSVDRRACALNFAEGSGLV